MAGSPITWRNINAPSFAGVQRGVSAGGQSISNGINTLANVAQGIGDEKKRSIQETKTTNTNDLLAQIASQNNLDNFGGMQEQVRGQVQGLGNEVDASKIYSALEQRQGALRTNATADTNYQDGLLSKAEQPAINEFKALVQGNDYKGAKAFLEQANIRNKAPLFASMESNQRDDTNYNTGQEDIRQKNFIAEAATRVGTFVDDDNLVIPNAKKILKQNGITGSNLTQGLDLIKKAWKRDNTLSQDAQSKIENTKLQQDDALQAAIKNRTKVKADLGIGTTPELIEAYSEQTSESAAIEAAAGKSGESTLIGFDTPYVGNGVQGAENTTKYAQESVTDFKNEMLTSLPDNKTNAPLRKLLTDGLPGAMITRAFQRTGFDESGEWNQKAFEKGLKASWDEYLTYVSDGNKDRQFDADTEAQVSKLKSTQQTNLNKLTQTETDKLNRLKRNQ
jgi:hypothetical protein